jgi:hypothetical protein
MSWHNRLSFGTTFSPNGPIVLDFQRNVTGEASMDRWGRDVGSHSEAGFSKTIKL